MNYFTEKVHSYGWRISLGLAAVPATPVLLGGILCAETRNSLVEQGKFEEARRIRVRGTKGRVWKLNLNFEGLLDASKEAQAVNNSSRTHVGNSLRRSTGPN